MQKRYEGEGAFEALSVLAVLTVIGAIAIAIVLFANSSQPHLVIDASGSVSVEKSTNATIVVAGIAIAVQGIVTGLILSAIASIGKHVVALRRQAEPAGVVAPPPPPTVTAPQPAYYAVVMDSSGTLDSRTEDKIIHTYLSEEELAGLSTPSTEIGYRTIVTGISYATAQPISDHLNRKGARTRVIEVPPP
jgi:hypothetical protein